MLSFIHRNGDLVGFQEILGVEHCPKMSMVCSVPSSHANGDLGGDCAPVPGIYILVGKTIYCFISILKGISR